MNLDIEKPAFITFMVTARIGLKKIAVEPGKKYELTIDAEKRTFTVSGGDDMKGQNMFLRLRNPQFIEMSVGHVQGHRRPECNSEKY